MYAKTFSTWLESQDIQSRFSNKLSKYSDIFDNSCVSVMKLVLPYNIWLFIFLKIYTWHGPNILWILLIYTNIYLKGMRYHVIKVTIIFIVNKNIVTSMQIHYKWGESNVTEHASCLLVFSILWHSNIKI